jgi:hypothetical protein
LPIFEFLGRVNSAMAISGSGIGDLGSEGAVRC